MGDGTVHKTPANIKMFHKAIDVQFKDHMVLEVAFQDGKVKSFDMSVLLDKYPQLKALEDHSLFCSGKLVGSYGIIWNDDLDIETETIYEEGIIVKTQPPSPGIAVGEAVYAARAKAGWSQKKLSEATGIDQSDISRIERGMANPSVGTLGRIAEALNCRLLISIG